MNIETKDFVEKLIIKWTDGLPNTKEDLFLSDITQVTALNIVDELCEALNIYED